MSFALNGIGPAVNLGSAMVTVTIESSGIRVSPLGDLTATTIGGMRAVLERGLPAKFAGGITLDLANVGRVDASGVSLAVFLYRVAKSRSIPFSSVGADKPVGLLVELALRGQDLKPAFLPAGLVREIGSITLSLRDLTFDLVRFFGEIALVILCIIRNPRLLRVRDTLAAMARHGTDAVPVISLLGLLIGAIIAFQTFEPLAKYGAKLQVADVVGISVVRELGPLITAIILAGRSGSAFAAEIGTMKVTQELDALRTFGIDPVRFLVIPRLLAVIVVTPLLSVFASVLGVLGGYLIIGPAGFSFAQYANEIRSALTIGGFLQGMVKAAAFAILIGSIGCLAGLKTGQGPGAVGLSTTRAVVSGITAIILADSVFGAFFYALGI